MRIFNYKFTKYLWVALTISMLIQTVNFTVLAKDLSLTAQSACVIEHYTDTLIYGKNADTVLPMASTTKIATAVTVLEHEKNLDRKVKISSTAAGVEGSSMYLKAGEEISVRDLLYGLMLVSGNDAATALSETVLGNKENFVAAMNDICTRLGLKNTHFKNPSGLPEDGHYTTATELARLTSYALTFPEFEKITASKEYRVKETNISSVRLLINHNKLLRITEECIGGKTGFTKTAGRCLVSIARKNGATVIAVTLNAPDDWNDHKKLYGYAFDKVKIQPSEKHQSVNINIKVSGGTKDNTELHSATSINSVWINDKEMVPDITAYTENFTCAPITENTVLGYITAGYNSKIICKSDLISAESIQIVPPKPLKIKFLNSIIKIFSEI